MAQDSEFKAVTDSWGNIDIAFYEAQAIKMRNEYLRKAFLKGMASVRETLVSWISAPSRTRNA